MSSGENKKRLKDIAKSNAVIFRKYNKEIKRSSRSINPNEYLTKMKNDENILEVENLKCHFYTDVGTVKAVDGVSFNVPVGKTIGIVGESGCGKSVTSLSIMRLLQGPVGQIVDGQIRFSDSVDGAVDLIKLPIEKMRGIRGKDIAMIFQEPMTSLNPIFTIGFQIDEAIALHIPSLSKSEVAAKTVEILTTVGIARPEGIYKCYPHELSGGMRQRVMIAMALCCEPKVIIADEPTTALDVTIQAQILELMRNIKDKIKASIVLITHDLGVVAEMADYVIVMYAGKVVEQGSSQDIYKNPKHPYTIGLLGSKPAVGKKLDKLYSIPGQVPNPINMPNYCYFRDRCDRATEKCAGVYPSTTTISPTHSVACCNFDK